MNQNQVERRIRALEARNHGNDYVSIQDANDEYENAHNPAGTQDAYLQSTDTRGYNAPTFTRNPGETDAQFVRRIQEASVSTVSSVLGTTASRIPGESDTEYSNRIQGS